MENNYEVNFYGFISLEAGLGEAARNNIEALKKKDVKVNVFDATSTAKITELNSSSINIVQINPDNLSNFFLTHGANLLKGKYNIAYWAWETDEFPEEYKIYFDYFNEIWTPSSYCQNVISKKSPIPVLNVPHAVPIGQINDNTALRHKVFGERKNTFIYSFFFDYKSQIVRKNVVGLIESFRLAFGQNNNDITLLLKTYPSKHHIKDKELIESLIANDSSIILFEESLERTELNDLLNITNCYVSLHHAEGFGLTMAEAMGYGKPVIATGYSGNTEYMNINNALLVKYETAKLETPVGPFPKGSCWANPSNTDAADLMKYVYENHNQLNSITNVAKDDIRNKFSLNHIGKLMYERLSIISKSIQNDYSESEISNLRLENNLLKIKLEKIKNLSFLKLKLKFKNFQNQIFGKNRKYPWE